MSTFVRLLIGISACVAILVITVVVLLYRSHYSGTEFSPDDFSARGFTYYKEPLTGFVLRGRAYTDFSLGGLDLVADGYIKPRIQTPQTWHLISDNTDVGRLPSHDCDARLLVEYLRLSTDRGENVWEIWNSDHPKLAKEFWPVVAEMARKNLYLVVSDVMEFGLDSTTKDIDQFKKELLQTSSEAYLKMAEIEFESSNHSKAKTLADDAKRYHSTDRVDQLLAKINQQLDQ
jgi:hypothetical protein